MQIPVSVKIVLGSATMPVANVLEARARRGRAARSQGRRAGRRRRQRPHRRAGRGRGARRRQLAFRRVADRSDRQSSGRRALPDAGCTDRGQAVGHRQLAISTATGSGRISLAMAETYDQDSKTEEPTEKKIRDSLEKGRVPYSREAAALASILAILVGYRLPVRRQRRCASSLARDLHRQPRRIPPRTTARTRSRSCCGACSTRR